MRSTSGVVFQMPLEQAPDLIPWDDLESSELAAPFDARVLGIAVQFWTRGLMWCEPGLAIEFIRLGQYFGCKRIEDAAVGMLEGLVKSGTVELFVLLGDGKPHAHGQQLVEQD